MEWCVSGIMLIAGDKEVWGVKGGGVRLFGCTNSGFCLVLKNSFNVMIE